jgi:hypothetical protein
VFRREKSVALIQPQRGDVPRLSDHHHTRRSLFREPIDGSLDQRTPGTLPLHRFIDSDQLNLTELATASFASDVGYRPALALDDENEMRGTCACLFEPELEEPLTPLR